MPKKHSKTTLWGTLRQVPKLLKNIAGKKPINNKHINKIFTGLSRDYPGTDPGRSRPFPEISWEFCLCVSLFPHEKRETHEQFDPHPFPGQSREVVYVFTGFFSPCLKSTPWGTFRPGHRSTPVNGGRDRNTSQGLRPAPGFAGPRCCWCPAFQLHS